jgi:hypothetical protein
VVGLTGDSSDHLVSEKEKVAKKKERKQVL